jgi:hypothetical protein
MACCLQQPNKLDLMFREYTRINVVIERPAAIEVIERVGGYSARADADPTRDRARRCEAVTSDHNDAHAEVLEPSYQRSSVEARRILQSQESGEMKHVPVATGRDAQHAIAAGR